MITTERTEGTESAEVRVKILSGTFRGRSGMALELAEGGWSVLLDGDTLGMWFSDEEVAIA